ncbi:MAG: AAA family ATPase [Candidatus Dormibacteraeota bacterium]|nr:AAA family ATPase [Candidatus Dormibacteraeota bacterium]
MKLQRVEIAGFGALSDVLVDFHPRLTLVLGDNESGKSTLHRAVRAALYGIDAGGQGRAVERSDWHRWRPWAQGPYAIALTYSLEDGRRIRVARSLDTRDQGVQVLELGGSDLTDELRSGRAVSPGRFHLGVDESVFCASAWLGDEALRIGAPDAAPARAEQLQEAIERLADTARGITATQAIARLKEAMDRVGSERRSTSPLGVASARLRDLDRRLEEARARLQALGAEEERLRVLDRDAANGRDRAAAAERAFLEGRVAAIVERKRRLDALRQETAATLGEEEETRHLAAFPLDVEERAATLAGELAQALRSADEAGASWTAAQDRLAEIGRRRAEVLTGLRAIPDTALDDTAVEQAQRLHGEVAAAQAAVARNISDPAAERRMAALRHEIARTGMGSLPRDSGDALAALVEQQRRRPRPVLWSALSVVLFVAAVVAGVELLRSHARPAALIAAGAGLALAAAGALWSRRIWRQARAVDERIARLEKAAGVGADEAALVAERVPSLQALHAALLREEGRAAGVRSEAEKLHGVAADLAERCSELAAALGVMTPVARAGATTRGLLEDAEAALAAAGRAITAHRRRSDLAREDKELAADEAELRRLGAAAERYRQIAERIKERLDQLLASAGLAPQATPAEAMRAVREACEIRRRHDEARRVLATARQRAAALGDEALLDRALEHLGAELEARGGSAALAAQLAPPDETALQALEDDARHAVQAAASATTQARELRGRLAGLLENAPDVADLQNERDACAAAKDRGLRQLAALNRASQLIDAASRATHRDLAPRLAERVAARLTTLTEARYETVNVDTEHFAVSLLTRQRPDMVPLDVVSHGTRDQVSLLLRIALCEVLSSSGEPIPLLLDEPMLTADPARRDLLVEFLHNLSETNQVVLTTNDPATVEAAQNAGADFAVVRMAGPRREVAGRAGIRVVSSTHA